MKEYKVGDYTCVVGGNAKENWEILSQAQQKYLFFHLSAFPSCYVILQTEEKVEKEIVVGCAEICLENTKQKNMSGIYVDCTPVGNVRKGEKIGEIYYVSRKKIETIRV
jgi:predicted ribosome quality control (RQC) complex YloA/Tae2 family protein